MEKNVGGVFVLLVCNNDGIVVLTFDEFTQVLNEAEGGTEWISASRDRRQMYSIKGSDGKLGLKVGKNEFLGKLFTPEKRTSNEKGPMPR